MQGLLDKGDGISFQIFVGKLQAIATSLDRGPEVL